MKLGHKREKAVDYRNFRISEWDTEEFRHVKLLLYWIIFGILFELLEFTHTPDYVLIHCSMDDHIPFCELFVIPYVLWFFYLIGMHLYTLLYDVETFKKMMYFIIFTYTAALAVYREYTSDPEICSQCPTLHLCTRSQNHVKTILRHVWKDYEELADDARYTQNTSSFMQGA